ncbi:DsbA family protein [Amylibacter sp.]|nr:DsbA family protein [Amylibacter sp.]
MDRRTFTSLLSLSAISASTAPIFAETTKSNSIDIPDMIMGSEDAPITIIEYASFTCPHCANFHKNVFPSLRKNYIDSGKVKFIYREVYFDGPGLWAALLARCGGDKKYFGISDLLYSKQREWTKGDGGAEIAQNLYKIGRIAGLQQKDMETCLQNKDVATAMVARFQETSKADNISSTPTLVLNGKSIGNMSYTELAALIDEAMS